MKTPTREEIESTLKSKGYVYFTGPKDFDVNIVGIRNSDTGNKVSNLFDDLITISYKENGAWKFHCWAATTDPGIKAVIECQNSGGVARLVPGQYRGSHMIRLHQGKYEALGQKGMLKCYRDKNKDMIFDESVITEGDNYGINIHRSNPNSESTFVENWSSGCSVFKKVKDFNEFMTICRKAAAIHGNSFTYTLINSNDIK